MSNKLVKKSPEHEKVKDWLREKVEKEGGVNITTDLMMSDECKDLKYDDFLDILGELSDEGCRLFTVERVSMGEKTGGMMLCRNDICIGFTPDPNVPKPYYKVKRIIHADESQVENQTAEQTVDISDSERQE